MSRVLRVPDEKFRDKVHKTLRDNLTTIRRELGEEKANAWDEATLNGMMAEEFQKLIGTTEPGGKDDALTAKMEDLEARMTTDAWLYQKGKRISGRDVKIRAGLNLVQRAHKAPGGLIRADFEVMDGRLGEVVLSGDFFCFPQGAVRKLEESLKGQPAGELRRLVAEFYAGHEVETPGITVDDWMQVLSC
jgi:lipoate-protein ligase A